MLDELDRELEARGHKFARYADDCNIYVRSERAGQRVMKSVSDFIARRLRLKVNDTKSAVARPHDRKFLGFSFTAGKMPRRRKIARQSLERFKNRVRQITNRKHSQSFEKRVAELSRYLSGWSGYFGYCETPKVLRDLDSWIRRRLRSVLWKQWKVFRRRRAELIKRRSAPGFSAYHGVEQQGAVECVSHPWRAFSLTEQLLRFDRPYEIRARLQYLTVTNRRVRTRTHGGVGGRSREASSYPESRRFIAAAGNDAAPGSEYWLSSKG